MEFEQVTPKPTSFLALTAGMSEQGEMAKQTLSTRRGFLKGSTGAGLLICSSQVAFGYKANERLNIASIGIGGRGDDNLRGVQGETIVALCDVDKKRGARNLAKYPKVKRFEDFRRMLAEMDKEMDETTVCSR